jgi:hypothetical protein
MKKRLAVSGVFAFVSVSLIACRDSPDPGGDEFDDEGIFIDDGATQDSGTADSGESTDDEAPPDAKLDALIEEEGSGTAEGGDVMEESCKKVDLLFVIDNSGSMEDEQINLVNSFPAFIDQIQVQLADTEGYHIGVISTDLYEFNEGCEAEGAMITATGGEGSSEQSCGPFVEGHSYMTEMDDLEEAFSCAAQIGIDGDSDERGMQTMKAALSDEMNEPGGCNEGFLRDDALLVIVLITDEEDDHEVDGCNQDPYPGSQGEPAEWYADVVASKAGHEKNIVVLSLIGPPGPHPGLCPGLDKCNGGKLGAEVGERIAEFTGMFTNGFIGRVCEPSYASFFEEAVAVIESACDEFEPIL